MDLQQIKWCLWVQMVNKSNIIPCWNKGFFDLR